MEKKEVFKKTSNLSIDIRKKREELNELLEKIGDIQENCDHSLSFKLNNDTPRMLVIDGFYYCPACGKIEEIIDREDLRYSCFKDSRVVDLTELSLLPNDTVLGEIRHEVYNNLDFYYGADTPDEELEAKMVETMRPRNMPFEKQKDILRRIREKKEN